MHVPGIYKSDVKGYPFPKTPKVVYGNGKYSDPKDGPQPAKQEKK